MSRAIRILGDAHDHIVHGRRVRALGDAIAPLLERGWHVLDVGCGDGTLAAGLGERCGLASIEGLEISERGETAIPVHVFDGRRIPLDDKSVDAVMMVDVLHHTDDPAGLLTEARRVARRAIVLKDHRMARPLAGPTLRFMDWVGNRPHGVVLPYNYWPEQRWRDEWHALGLRVEQFSVRLGLYPWATRWLFEWGLHFVARLGT